MIGNEAAVRLAIVGTRSLRCRGDVHRARKYVTDWITRLTPTAIITGDAMGVEWHVRDLVRSKGFTEPAGTLIVHRSAVRKLLGPGGYRERDEAIVGDCTHLLRVACRQAGQYSSTWVADEAVRLGRIVIRENTCAGRAHR
jgi:hypothetical protein